MRFLLRPISTEGYALPPVLDGELGKAPQLQWIEIARLVVDETYQRRITGEGRRNVLKIAANFRWSSFTPVVCSPVAMGKFAILDGQHRSTAAALRGIVKVPCNVVAASPAEQARSFRDINAAVTKITPLTIHAAEVAAGDRQALAIEKMARDAGVTILRYPVSVKNQQLEKLLHHTMAIGTLRECYRAHGPELVTMALRCVTSSARNATPGVLNSHVIKALVAVLALHPTWRAVRKLVAAFEQVHVFREFDKALAENKPQGTSIAMVLERRLTAALTRLMGGAS